jgi:CDP-diacylglycerol---glycerol-3-phosphate 3-phosphatidyltransferase
MDFRRSIGSKITTPIVPFLSKIGITPDILTIIGCVVNIGAAVLVAMNNLLVGGILTLVSGLFDILDGALARYTGKSTKFGALLDSTLDRVSEAVIFFGLVILYAGAGNLLMCSLAIAALIFSFLISYVRARAEGLDIECSVGFFTRTERVLIMAFGLIFSIFIPYLMLIVLSILVIFSFITVIQRIVHVYKQTRNK